MKIIKLLLITTAAAAVLFGSGTSNAAKQVAQHHKAQKHEKTLIEVIKHGVKKYGSEDPRTIKDVEEAIKKHKKDPEYINAWESNFQSALMYTCIHIHGASEILKLLLDNGADIEAGRDPERSNTPLLQALRHRDTEKAKLLIERGANVNAKCGCGSNCILTPLREAVEDNDLDTVKLLIKKGAVDIKGYYDTALINAASNGKAEIVQELLDSKDSDVDINYQDTVMPWDSETAIMVAAEKGHVDVVKILLDHGADVTKKKEDQKTALELAEGKLKEYTEKYTEIIKLLKNAEKKKS